MADTTRSDLEQAKNKIHSGVEDLADRAKSVVDSASAGAAETLTQVEEAAKQAWAIGHKLGAQAKDKAQDVAGQVSDQAGRTLEAVSRQVRAEPILSIVVAGAIGYFIGLIVHRR